VEVVLNRQDRRYVLHLLDYSVGDPDRTPPRQEVRVHGIEVQCNLSRLGPLTRASVAASGAPVPARVEGEHLVVEVPPLGAQIALVLE
jgi:hypothetical protein